MNKILMSLVLVLIVSMSQVYAATPAEKLGRGFENIITSPVEIVKQTRWAWIEGSAKTFHISAWLLSGVVKGGAMTIGRIGSGIFDLVTFPINTNSLITPANVFQEWPERKPGVIYKQLGDK